MDGLQREGNTKGSEQMSNRDCGQQLHCTSIGRRGFIFFSCQTDLYWWFHLRMGLTSHPRRPPLPPGAVSGSDAIPQGISGSDSSCKELLVGWQAVVCYYGGRRRMSEQTGDSRYATAP